MMNLGCVVIDDEPLAVDLLRTYVERTPFLDLKGTFTNAVEALPLINSGAVNVVFLDINMPQINGMEFSKTFLPAVKVIFTTAYDQYAIEGFRLNALDYLLKPIDYSTFLEAANRAREWFGHTQSDQGKSLFIKSGYRMEKLDFDDIIYIENQKDYVKFHLQNRKEPVSSLMNIQSLSEKLPSDRFMRVHRSFIVNLDKVKTIERNSIVFGKEYIPVSDTYKEKFQEFLKKHFY